MRKAVFFDIDGTIWDEKHQIPDSTREAFRKMKDQWQNQSIYSRSGVDAFGI